MQFARLVIVKTYYPLFAALATPLTVACAAIPLAAEESRGETFAFSAALTYADLVDLADRAPLVLRAQVRDQAMLEPERAPGVAPGHARLYVEARTNALIAGNMPIGESLRYLVDVPLDGDGDPPKFKKREVILFARAVPGRPGEIQLVNPQAQLLYDPMLEARLRPILAALVEADAPPRITGVRDALSVPGALVGESETQIFLDAENDAPVSITVVRRPNMAPVWGVSWTEIVDRSARPPAPESLEWYRLACSLPAQLPSEANLARDSRNRARAAQDYAFVIDRLSPCNRSRPG